jgi:hypothetical protein
LHRLGWGQAYRVFVDPVEGEIIYQPWASVALWDAAQGGDSKVGKVFDRFERQHGPKGLGVEIGHLVADEFSVCLG